MADETKACGVTSVTSHAVESTAEGNGGEHKHITIPEVEQKAVSIIIATHDDEATIGECVKSIITQGMDPKDYEIIVLDDASSDETLKTLDEAVAANAKDKVDIYVARSEVALGSGAAYNNGFKQSSGKYVWFLDAACRVENGALAKIVSECKREDSEDCFVVTCSDFADLPMSLGGEEVTTKHGLAKSCADEPWRTICKREKHVPFASKTPCHVARFYALCDGISTVKTLDFAGCSVARGLCRYMVSDSRARERAMSFIEAISSSALSTGKGCQSWMEGFVEQIAEMVAMKDRVFADENVKNECMRRANKMVRDFFAGYYTCTSFQR